MPFEFVKALDFDRAWLNLEPTIPLDPLPDGRPNPFYVERPGNPSEQLEASLLAPYYSAPKLFFSGHRGCGKSTELRRIAVQRSIRAKYFPVHFTIRDEADIYDLDFKDVLLALGGHLYREYTERCGKLPQALENELQKWQGKVEQEIIRSSPFEGAELQGSVSNIFLSAGLRLKLEPATRVLIRQVIEQHVTGLIKVINEISAAIQERQGRLPLVLIDDLDKPDLKTTQEIFRGHRETMLQPECAIVYTISSPLFYTPEFEAIRDHAIFLPNVKLHSEADPRPDRKGYVTMREFVSRRMDLSLVGPRALNQAIKISGGVFRELGRVMRGALRLARKDGRVELAHVRAVEGDIRGEYRRLLTTEQKGLLKQVYKTNRLEDPQRFATLLQMLAVLEYADIEPWWDVHPALVPMLEENGHGPVSAARATHS